MSSSFTPIIFCGPGSSLYPLCDADDESSSSIPKACLPILNLPLISFPLQSILNSGLRKVFVLAKGNQHSEIMKSLSKIKLLDPSSSSTSSDQSNIQIHQITNIKDNSIAISLHPNNSILVELIPLGPSDQASIASKKPTTSNTAKESENPRDRLYDTDRSLGTAELLRWLAINGKIQAPPLILPLDFISPSFSLTDFLLNYHSSSLPNPPILQTIFYEKGYESKSSLLSKEREKDLNASSGEGKSLLIGFDSDELSSSIKPSQNQLSNTSDGLLTSQHNLRLITPLNSDEGSSELDLRSDLLKKSHKLKLSKKFSDSSIYILDLDKILPLLISYPKITSIRQHLLPFIVKCSWQSGLKSKVGWKFPSESSSSSSLEDGEEGDDSSENERRRGSVNQMEQEKENETIDYREISSKKAGIFDLDLEMRSKKGKVKKDDTVGVKCLTTIIRFRESNKDEKASTTQDDGDDGFVIRANTLPAYLETNRYLLTRLSTSPTFRSILPILIPSNETSNQATATEPLISTSSHLSNDSLVGENVKIGDRTTIKKSVIGKSSILSKNVKLMGCVIGEKVRVGENSKLDLCILASNCKVGEKCVLKDCDVGPGAVVPAGTNAKGEKYSVEEEDGDEEDDGLVGEDEE